MFIGSTNARTFDFSAGDSAVFPDSSGQFTPSQRSWNSKVDAKFLGRLIDKNDLSLLGNYIENTSPTENLTWIEIYQGDRVSDISLTQWLALTPPDLVASVLKIPIDVVKTFKKEEQLLIAP